MDKWTLASEMLPDDGVRVLVCTEHEMFGSHHYTQMDITIGECTDGKWKCVNFIGNRVIAWMPLPVMPKEV